MTLMLNDYFFRQNPITKYLNILLPTNNTQNTTQYQSSLSNPTPPATINTPSISLTNNTQNTIQYQSSLSNPTPIATVNMSSISSTSQQSFFPQPQNYFQQIINDAIKKSQAEFQQSSLSNPTPPATINTQQNSSIYVPPGKTFYDITNSSIIYPGDAITPKPLNPIDSKSFIPINPPAYENFALTPSGQYILTGLDKKKQDEYYFSEKTKKAILEGQEYVNKQKELESKYSEASFYNNLPSPKEIENRAIQLKEFTNTVSSGIKFTPFISVLSPVIDTMITNKIDESKNILLEKAKDYYSDVNLIKESLQQSINQENDTFSPKTISILKQKIQSGYYIPLASTPSETQKLIEEKNIQRVPNTEGWNKMKEFQLAYLDVATNPNRTEKDIEKLKASYEEAKKLIDKETNMLKTPYIETIEDNRLKGFLKYKNQSFDEYGTDSYLADYISYNMIGEPVTDLYERDLEKYGLKKMYEQFKSPISYIQYGTDSISNVVGGAVKKASKKAISEVKYEKPWEDEILTDPLRTGRRSIIFLSEFFPALGEAGFEKKELDYLKYLDEKYYNNMPISQLRYKGDVEASGQIGRLFGSAAPYLIGGAIGGVAGTTISGTTNVVNALASRTPEELVGNVAIGGLVPIAGKYLEMKGIGSQIAKTIELTNEGKIPLGTIAPMPAWYTIGNAVSKYGLGALFMASIAGEAAESIELARRGKTKEAEDIDRSIRSMFGGMAVGEATLGRIGSGLIEKSMVNKIVKNMNNPNVQLANKTVEIGGKEYNYADIFYGKNKKVRNYFVNDITIPMTFSERASMIDKYFYPSHLSAKGGNFGKNKSTILLASSGSNLSPTRKAAEVDQFFVSLIGKTFRDPETKKLATATYIGYKTGASSFNNTQTRSLENIISGLKEYFSLAPNYAQNIIAYKKFKTVGAKPGMTPLEISRLGKRTMKSSPYENPLTALQKTGSFEGEAVINTQLRTPTFTTYGNKFVSTRMPQFIFVPYKTDKPFEPLRILSRPTKVELSNAKIKPYQNIFSKNPSSKSISIDIGNIKSNIGTLTSNIGSRFTHARKSIYDLTDALGVTERILYLPTYTGKIVPATYKDVVAEQGKQFADELKKEIYAAASKKAQMTKLEEKLKKPNQTFTEKQKTLLQDILQKETTQYYENLKKPVTRQEIINLREKINKGMFDLLTTREEVVLNKMIERGAQNSSPKFENSSAPRSLTLQNTSFDRPESIIYEKNNINQPESVSNMNIPSKISTTSSTTNTKINVNPFSNSSPAESIVNYSSAPIKLSFISSSNYLPIFSSTKYYYSPIEQSSIKSELSYSEPSKIKESQLIIEESTTPEERPKSLSSLSYPSEPEEFSSVKYPFEYSRLYDYGPRSSTIPSRYPHFPFMGPYSTPSVGKLKNISKNVNTRVPRKKPLIQFKSSHFRKFALGEKDLIVSPKNLHLFKDIISKKGTFFGYDVVPTQNQLNKLEKELLKSNKELVGLKDKNIFSIQI